MGGSCGKGIGKPLQNRVVETVDPSRLDDVGQCVGKPLGEVEAFRAYLLLIQSNR